MKILSIVIVLLIILTIPVSATDWKTPLKELIVEDYPSLCDDEVRVKNFEAFARYVTIINDLTSEEIKYYIATEFSHDILSVTTHWNPDNMYYMFIPSYLGLFDLDNDNIPEVFIGIAPEPAFGGSSAVAYKLYGTSYEKIGGLAFGEYGEMLFIDSQNKIVSIDPDSFRFLEIIDKKFVYSEYVDTNGSTTYKGISFNELGGYSYTSFGFSLDAWDEILYDLNLQLLPITDGAYILDEIKNPPNPQTDDNFSIYIIIFSIAVLTLIITRRKWEFS